MSIRKLMMLSFKKRAGSVTFLDSYISNIQGAYSTSKLFSTSTSCLRLRRRSDNAEQDFSFIGDFIDIDGIIAFVGNSVGYVTTWYDQSGKGHHCVQSTTSNQPKIKIECLGGLPSILFNGATSWMQTSAFFNSSFDNSATFFTLANKYSDTAKVHEGIPVSDYFAGRGFGTAPQTIRYNKDSVPPASGYKQNQKQTLLETYVHSTSAAQIYINNIKYSEVTGTTSPIGLSGSMNIGQYNGGDYYWDGEIMAKIYLNTALSDSDIKVIGKKLGEDFNMLQELSLRFDGNSIPYGRGTSFDNPTYPGTSWVSQLISALGGDDKVPFINQAQNGISIEGISTNFSLSNVYNTNGFCKKNIAFFQEGTNSITAGDSAATAFSTMSNYLLKYKNLGYTVIVLTCLARQVVPGSDYNATNVSGVSTNSHETQRLAFNQLVRDNLNNNMGYDYIVDIASNLKIGQLSSIIDTEYFNSDAVHPNNMGATEISSMVYKTLIPLLT